MKKRSTNLGIMQLSWCCKAVATCKCVLADDMLRQRQMVMDLSLIAARDMKLCT